MRGRVHWSRERVRLQPVLGGVGGGFQEEGRVVEGGEGVWRALEECGGGRVMWRGGGGGSEGGDR